MTDAAITLLDDWRSGQRCPWRPVKSKRRWLARSVASVDTVLVHATGVLGGFGVSEAQARDAFGSIAPIERLAALADYKARGALYHVLKEEADRVARLARYRETPYHGLYSPRDRASVVQWPATDFTYHGNRPNAVSVGWAYDGSFKPLAADEVEELDRPLDVEGGRESLRHLIRAALEQGCPLRRVSPHAQHANKPHDPGARVWLEVVEPVAFEFGLAIDVDWVTGNGRDEIYRWRTHVGRPGKVGRGEGRPG